MLATWQATGGYWVMVNPWVACTVWSPYYYYTVCLRLFADNCSNYSTVYNKCTTNRTETDREYKQRSTTNATYEQRNTPKTNELDESYNWHMKLRLLVSKIVFRSYLPYKLCNSRTDFHFFNLKIFLYALFQQVFKLPICFLLSGRPPQHSEWAVFYVPTNTV